jgi:hypothetical protein
MPPTSLAPSPPSRPSYAARLSSYFVPPGPHIFPTPTQVLEVQQILSELLPLELSFPIMDHAKYYTSQVSERSELKMFTDRGGRLWGSAAGNEDSVDFLRNWEYLESKPVWGRCRRSTIKQPGQSGVDSLLTGLSADPNDTAEQEEEDNIWKIKHITVSLSSKDQGWSGTPELIGTYEQSYSWFEIGIKRPIMTNPPLPEPTYEYLPGQLEIQKNKHAFREFSEHEIFLPLSSPFIQRLRKGDKIVVLAKARYPVSSSLCRIQICPS